MGSKNFTETIRSLVDGLNDFGKSYERTGTAFEIDNYRVTPAGLDVLRVDRLDNDGDAIETILTSVDYFLVNYV